MEKRVLIAVVLSIAVMYGYSILFPPPRQLPPEKGQISAVAPQAETVPVKNLSLPGEASSPASVNTADNVKTLTVETDFFRA